VKIENLDQGRYSTMAVAVLIIDDEVILAKSIHRYLERHNYDVRSVASAKNAATVMDSFHPDIVLLDYQLPDGNGIDVLRSLKQNYVGAKFIFMTGHGSIALAVEAMKEGASEFISKPIILEELRLLLEKVSGLERAEKTLSYFRNKQAEKGTLSAILGESQAIKDLRSQIEMLLEAEKSLGGEAPPPVLITGETGTGKQLVARALHFDSGRSNGPFIELNCAALPDQLVESELFGHERGAFTDAKERKTGLIEAAHGGTLFLDEIGELSLNTQAKLLKTLEDQTVRRLGSVRDHSVSVRIVAATNRNLPEMISNGTFRSDLYFRLHMLQLTVPPLRVRGTDILFLADRFLKLKGDQYKRAGLKFSDEANFAMLCHNWPGNVRELRNVIERAILLTKGTVIGPSVLAVSTTKALPVASDWSNSAININEQDPGNMDLIAVEKNTLMKALNKAKWNVSEASRLLGVSRDTLRYRMEKFEMQKPGKMN
jgi:two-component system, NtrC family, response regulator AtoC